MRKSAVARTRTHIHTLQFNKSINDFAPAGVIKSKEKTNKNKPNEMFRKMSSFFVLLSTTWMLAVVWLPFPPNIQLKTVRIVNAWQSLPSILLPFFATICTPSKYIHSFWCFQGIMEINTGIFVLIYQHLHDCAFNINGAQAESAQRIEIKFKIYPEISLLILGMSPRIHRKTFWSKLYCLFGAARKSKQQPLIAKQSKRENERRNQTDWLSI